MYGIENVSQVFELYMGVTVFMPMFLVCVIYSFCHGDEIGRKRLAFIIILSVLLIFNNLSFRLIGKLTGTETYYRFIWAVPILPVIAWAGTKAVMERKKLWEKLAVCVLAVALFRGGTSTFLTEGSIGVPENIYSLPDDAVQVCEVIEQDKDKERPVVIFDLECQLAARLYDPKLVWGISRKAYQEYNNIDGYENVKKKYRAEKAMIHAVNFGVKDEGKRLSGALKKKKVDYIVTFTAYGMDSYFAEAGYGLVDVRGERSIYARIESDLEVNQ